MSSLLTSVLICPPCYIVWYIDISIYPPCRSINYYHTGRDIPKKSEIASYKACPAWRTAYSGATLLHELHKAFFLARSAKSVAKAHLQAADSHLQADSEWNLHILKGSCMNFCKLNTVTLKCISRLCTHELSRMFIWSDTNWYIIIWSGCKQCYELHNAIQGGAFCNMSSKMHH